MYTEWLKDFLEIWEKQAGYPLTLDVLFEEHLLADYYDEHISPSDAVTEEMSEF